VKVGTEKTQDNDSIGKVSFSYAAENKKYNSFDDFTPVCIGRKRW
jgi:hypothetical protein